MNMCACVPVYRRQIKHVKHGSFRAVVCHQLHKDRTLIQFLKRIALLEMNKREQDACFISDSQL